MNYRYVCDWNYLEPFYSTTILSQFQDMWLKNSILSIKIFYCSSDYEIISEIMTKPCTK